MAVTGSPPGQIKSVTPEGQQEPKQQQQQQRWNTSSGPNNVNGNHGKQYQATVEKTLRGRERKSITEIREKEPGEGRGERAGATGKLN